MTLGQQVDGNAIRRHRESMGWTQAELASRVGTSTSAISRIETGDRKPSARVLARLVEVLAVGVELMLPQWWLLECAHYGHAPVAVGDGAPPAALACVPCDGVRRRVVRSA